MSRLDDTDLFELGPFESSAALYLESGWHPLPLPYRCKKSPPVGFTGAGHAEADATQVAAWMGRWSGGNIALAMGPLDMGIDVDSYGDKPGGATLADLEAKLGPLPATWISTARSDDPVSGIRYYRLPSPVELITKLPGIEIIQERHRYAVAPPSIHKDTGTTYLWRNSATGVESARIPPAGERPLLPDVWIEYLTDDEAARSETRAKTKKAARVPGPIDGTRSRAVDDAVRYAIAELDKGSRHDAMVAGALALARLEERGHPGTDDAIGDLQTAFVTAIGDDREHADQEFEAALDSGRHKAATTAAKTPRWEELTHGHPPDVTDVAASTLARRNVDPETGEKIGDEPATNPLLERMVAATLTTTELKDRKPAPMLIEGFLPLDSSVVLFGPSGGNKTFVVLDMVLHIATGSWWWGQETRAGRVVYVLAEGAGRFGKRIDSWQRHHGIQDLDKYHAVTWLTRAVNLHAVDSVAAFIEYLGDDPPALIVFDTLARNIVGVEENSARDMGQVIDHLDLIRRHTGACVLLVHHSGLAGGRARGSTALFGSIDTELELVPDEDRATLKVTKQKDGAEANPRHFERINVGDSCVMVPVTRDREQLPAGARATLDALSTVAVDGGVSTTVWRSATDIAERTFYNHRAGLLQAGLVQNVGGSRQPLYIVSEVPADEG